MNRIKHLLGLSQRKLSHSQPLPPRRRARLILESLETRLAPAHVFVVPLVQPEDGTHFHSLSSAITAAGERGQVTIEPGASPQFDNIQVHQVISIRGDANVPASILPSYSIDIGTTGSVVLENLNVNTLMIGNGGQASVSKCLIQTIDSDGGDLG